jgi:hypothetical protein
VLNAIFRPLDKWPGEPTPPGQRKSTPFKASYTDTLDLLESELKQLHAKNVVIECQVTREQIRNDGWLKSNSAVAGPAVILTFTRNQETYRYPCDTFKSMHANVRAIALALEALRKIDRYGVTSSGEQYQGFKQLPSGAPPAAAKMTPREAAKFICDIFPGISEDVILSARSWAETAVREAQRQLHPDAGGAHDDFVRLQEADGVIAAYFEQQGKGAGR